ncbi:unnamed protein product [Symbiodinium microadriaticum]|nr:unnamed protein product [Symbiodinium microadriaticum]
MPLLSQASSVANGELPNIDVFVNLTIAHEADKQIPADLLQAAVEEFATRWELRPQAARRVTTLPPAGQCFALQNFRGDPRGELTNSEALESYVEMLRRLESPPWGNSACTLRVESTGAIIGRCCPDLDALCREDPPERLAQAHCKIRSEKDRFFLCDMETTDEGTTLDGYAVNSDWVGPLKSGSQIPGIVVGGRNLEQRRPWTEVGTLDRGHIILGSFSSLSEELSASLCIKAGARTDGTSDRGWNLEQRLDLGQRLSLPLVDQLRSHRFTSVSASPRVWRHPASGLPACLAPGPGPKMTLYSRLRPRCI